MANRQLSDIQSKVRDHYKNQKAFERQTALKAAGKIPKTVLKSVGDGRFSFRCSNKTVREATQTECEGYIASTASSVQDAMIRGCKSAAEASDAELTAAVSAATHKLEEAYERFKQQVQAGGGRVDSRYTQTYKTVRLDLQAAISSLLIRMKDRIVGPPPPPPPPPAAAEGAAAGEDANMQEGGEDATGPGNQEAAAAAAAEAAAAVAPIATAAEVAQLVKAEVQAIMAGLRPPKKNNQPRQQQANRAQQPRRPQQQQPRQGRQFFVLQQPQYQGCMGQPAPRQQQGRYHRQQQQQQQQHRQPRRGNRQQQRGRQQPRNPRQQQQQQAQAFQLGPPGFRGFNPNFAGPGDLPINGYAILQGRNGGNASIWRDNGGGAARRGQQNKRRYR